MSGLAEAAWLSLRISFLATLLAAFIAVPLAYVLARRRFVGKSLLEALLLMPIVLPPTVVGFLLIMTLGSRGWLGQHLGGYSIVFRFEGAVLAAMIVALPMLYLPVRSGFASIEPEYDDMARTLGANRLQLFWHVSIPLARRALASGLVLAFARALGEFGATVMVFGLQPRRVTLPVSIYLDYEHGQAANALSAVMLLSIISLVLVLIYQRITRGRGAM